MIVSTASLYLSISQVVFLGIGAFVLMRNSHMGRLFVALSACILIHLLALLFEVGPGSVTSFFLSTVLKIIPITVWLVAFSLFEGGRKVPRIFFKVMAIYLLLAEIGLLHFHFSFIPRFNLSQYMLFYIAPQLICIGAYIYVLRLAVLEYRQDLVEGRKSLRIIFVLVIGGFWLFQALRILIRLVVLAGWEDAKDLETFVNSITGILLFPVVLVVNICFLRAFASIAKVENHAGRQLGEEALPYLIDSRDLELKETLLNYMEWKRPYCRSGLTIGRLANEMGVQEYKLRTIVNRILNYNNFSQFLNKYRIRDAEFRLLKTDDAVFNIGLDVGYTSLSTFHKAFKECHGITPKEFRIVNRTGSNGKSESLRVQVNERDQLSTV